MTDNWIIQDIEKHIAHRNRVVIIDPSGEYAYLLPYIEKQHYTILKTESSNKEEWQRIKEELMLRYEAESKHKVEKVVFYVNRPITELSFLFDYCFTHGCVDLSNPVEWLRKKLFTSTGHQITLENPMLLTAAKLGIGKDLAWWKKILQNLEELVSIEDELIPFLSNPEGFFKDKEADVKRLFEEKLFELIGQTYRKVPAKTLATEVVNHLFSSLVNNDVSPELLRIYHKWLDSHTYSKALQEYINTYKVDPYLNIWNVHPDHCFATIDKKQLLQITANFRDKVFVKEKLQKLHHRIKSRKATNFVPKWWDDVITLFEFDNKPLAHCNSLEKVSSFYTTQFHKADRAIRNIYAEFLQEENIVRPIQEHYESLNHELLQHWFDCSNQYQSNQQGYLPKLIAQAKPGTAIIVGDGVRYEIAAFIASQLQQKCKVSLDVMLADMPSETEHNMSALYVGNNEVIPLHKDREKRLSESTGKEIMYMNLEALHYGIKADYLVLTYKDIDSAGEKLQMGAIKLFREFEIVLTEKIQLLLNMSYHQVHLVTDHGFVLTGLLDEADKIDPIVSGKKEVHERFIRTTENQSGTDWIPFEKTYSEFKYVYAAKSHRPFKSKGVYGFSHGGFTPQEIIIPNFVFSKDAPPTKGLEVNIANKKELIEVTGELFGLKIQATAKADDLFSASRIIQVLLYANNITYSSSNIITIEPGATQSFDFSFGGHNEIIAVVVDANSQEQMDSVKIKKSNARDLGGLF
ncbi:MAG: PglZ domain-containing protein [Sphingobacteriales bacterium]|nr:MAG: PglZ domain-containing protein [Sphingobacteriales bacterium]